MMRVGPEALISAVRALCPHVLGSINPSGSVPTERNLWIELWSCILGSRVPFDIAYAASCRIRRTASFKWVASLEVASLECAFAEMLSRPLPVRGRSCRYRFPFSRARQIAGSYQVFRDLGRTLREFVFLSEREPPEIRDELAKLVPGLGPKQASMFLRNVGRSDDLAIIDSHVLGFMARVGLCDRSVRPPATLKSYERLEKIIRSFSSDLGYALGCVDRAVWVVMRVAQNENEFAA